MVSMVMGISVVNSDGFMYRGISHCGFYRRDVESIFQNSEFRCLDNYNGYCL